MKVVVHKLKAIVGIIKIFRARVTTQWQYTQHGKLDLDYLAVRFALLVVYTLVDKPA